MVTGKTIQIISKLIQMGWKHDAKPVKNTMYCVDTCHLGITVVEVCTIKSRKVNGRQQAERFLSAHVTDLSSEFEIKSLKELEQWVLAQSGA